MIIDTIISKDTSKTTAEEYFLIPHDNDKSCEKIGGSWSWNVEVNISDENNVELQPNCNQLKESSIGTTDSIGLAHFKITAASLRSVFFTLDKPEYIVKIPLFGDDALTMSDEEQTVLSMTNIANQRIERKLLRWKPNTEIANDIRIFVLQTALKGQIHKNVNISFEQHGNKINASLNGLSEDLVISFDGGEEEINIKSISTH